MPGIMHGTIAQFGTHTADEEKATFSMKFTASTFLNREGVWQIRSIDKADRRLVHQYILRSEQGADRRIISTVAAK